MPGTPLLVPVFWDSLAASLSFREGEETMAVTRAF